MLLYCPNKKCNTPQDHKLQIDTNEAVCLFCNEPNTMVTPGMKSVLKSSGDVIRVAKKKEAFIYRCDTCNIDTKVKIVDEQPVCPKCSNKLNISTIMVDLVRNAGAEFKKDDVEEDFTTKTPAEELNKGIVRRKKVVKE